MSLFQKNVLKEYAQAQNSEAVQQAFEKFKTHFGNPQMQELILTAKEEQYQEGFLKDLMVEVFGYTLFPSPDYDLITEFKNPNNAKKADAVLLKKNPTQNKESAEINSQVWAIIELKDTRTSFLKIVESQAFGYKNQHPNCRYVITSNFKELWFYIDNAYDYEAFDLFNLTLPEFAKLYTLIQKDNLFSNLPIEIKNKSIAREQELTLAFYDDYQAFKDHLFINIALLNKKQDKFLLFEKTQKLLDRIIFLCFASAKGLLPANMIKILIQQWEYLNDIGEPVTLYSRFVKYFSFIDKGFKSRIFDIFAYNGGLFAPDPLLDGLQIQDETLRMRCEWIARYDFDTDIDINVLGHIFEHSLNELDQKRLELMEDLAEIEAGNLPKNMGKRKADGIFYTPIYITQYMVEETIGVACRSKKRVLEIEEIEIDWENQIEKDFLLERLSQYENWLSNLRILDPACGSGAFLNQVLSFLIYEYRWIESLKLGILPPPKPKLTQKDSQENVGNIFEKPLPMPTTKPKEKNFIHKILENNIFGVDLNSESVSITKLSLWLKTAQMRQRLNELADNIKVGNSLIDDSEIDPKAFEWRKEFPQVFEEQDTENQGFSIIIGNPPYVRQELLSEKHKNYFSKKYPEVYSGVADLYVYFYSKALELLQKNGILAYITPNKWFKTKYGEGLRRLLQPLQIQQIVDFFELPVFEDAATEPQIIILSNQKTNTNFYYFPVTKKLLGEAGIVYFADKLTTKIEIKKELLNTNEWVFTTEEKQELLHKIKYPKKLKVLPLRDYANQNIYRGITTGLNRAFIIDHKIREKLIKEDYKSNELIKPYCQATDIKKWHLENKKMHFLINTGYDIEISKNSYPAIFNYLKAFEKELKARQDQGKTHFNLRPCNYYAEFEKPKIMYIHTAVRHEFYYDEKGYFLNNSAYFISQADRFLCAFLNSKLFDFYKKLTFVAYGNPEERGRNKLDFNKMIQVPIPCIEEEDKLFFQEKHQILQQKSEAFYKKDNAFKTIFSGEFKLSKLSKKLEKWHWLEWAAFQTEIEKQKGQIPTKRKMEWLELFEQEGELLRNLEQQIEQEEKQLNEKIYQIYDLSKKEIEIIEHEYGY
ncbi:Eco57I restriction-modification methylase domain-containing protein [Hugenholtzia roseola]|uniref:Eco57I restriction-modification methylase domain-containing protein n=1 Tax=Hugenholtzia roseola TaxID=1002 RepID=UPI0013769835|nr:DNA methyltransferase [Hugenholtzia roseola]